MARIAGRCADAHALLQSRPRQPPGWRRQPALSTRRPGAPLREPSCACLIFASKPATALIGKALAAIHSIANAIPRIHPSIHRRTRPCPSSLDTPSRGWPVRCCWPAALRRPTRSGWSRHRTRRACTSVNTPITCARPRRACWTNSPQCLCYARPARGRPKAAARPRPSSMRRKALRTRSGRKPRTRSSTAARRSVRRCCGAPRRAGCPAWRSRWTPPRPWTSCPRGRTARCAWCSRAPRCPRPR